MKNPLTLFRTGRGPVLDFYRSGTSNASGYRFSRGDRDDALVFLFSGGIRGRCVAIGWYRR